MLFKPLPPRPDHRRIKSAPAGPQVRIRWLGTAGHVVETSTTTLLLGVHADALLVGLAGRRGTHDYLRRLTEILRPSLVLPTHHDAFFAPMSDDVRLLPGIDLDGFFSDLTRVAPAATLMTPTYDDVVILPVNGAARDAVMTLRS